jgi:hypothetical protein
MRSKVGATDCTSVISRIGRRRSPGNTPTNQARDRSKPRPTSVADSNLKKSPAFAL